MNGKIAILATTSILTFGVAIPAYAQNDNQPAGSFRFAEEAGAMSEDDGNMEEQALEEDGLIPESELDELDEKTPGKTMESDPK
ncbi:MAG: hypothetical protein ACPW61_13175 [Methyloligella sp. ZOD6]